jgi:hypothetical protein
MSNFTVTKKAKRPAIDKPECFYCQQKIGGFHKDDCVLINRKVTVRMTVDYEVDVPAHWDAHMVEFHRNDGSWCADNALDELTKIADEAGCICHIAKFEHISDNSEPFLDE